jgi:hypothetical protein
MSEEAKRTIENCSLNRRAKLKTLQYDGKCEGYFERESDDLLKQCKECKFNVFYGEQSMKSDV